MEVRIKRLSMFCKNNPISIVQPHPVLGHLKNLLPHGYGDQSTIDKAFMEKGRILSDMIASGRLEKNPGAFRVEAFNPVMNLALGTVIIHPTDVNVITDLLSGRAQDSQVKGKEYRSAFPLIGGDYRLIYLFQF